MVCSICFFHSPTTDGASPCKFQRTIPAAFPVTNGSSSVNGDIHTLAQRRYWLGMTVMAVGGGAINAVIEKWSRRAHLTTTTYGIRTPFQITRAIVLQVEQQEIAPEAGNDDPHAFAMPLLRVNPSSVSKQDPTVSGKYKALPLCINIFRIIPKTNNGITGK